MCATSKMPLFWHIVYCTYSNKYCSYCIIHTIAIGFSKNSHPYSRNCYTQTHTAMKSFFYSYMDRPKVNFIKTYTTQKQWQTLLLVSLLEKSSILIIIHKHVIIGCTRTSNMQLHTETCGETVTVTTS